MNKNFTATSLLLILGVSLLINIYLILGEIPKSTTPSRETMKPEVPKEENIPPITEQTLLKTNPKEIPKTPMPQVATNIIEEAGNFEESADQNWWLNSGGYLFANGTTWQTIQGELGTNDKWRILYNASNPQDTDGGSHPQNILRLLTKSVSEGQQQEAYFTIKRENLSQSPNRAPHNGLLFMSRYLDSKNLYYAGIRVDGQAVIKKKIGGRYYTLSIKKVFDGIYDRNNYPNLLPKNIPIGLKSVVVTNVDNSVSIKLYINLDSKGSNWTEIAEAIDHGEFGPPLTNPSHAGIRTDFLDVEISNYKLTSLITGN